MVTHCRIILNYFDDCITLLPIRVPLSVVRFNAQQQPNLLSFLLNNCLPPYVTTFAWERQNIEVRSHCYNNSSDFFLDHKRSPPPPSCFLFADIVRVVRCRIEITRQVNNTVLNFSVNKRFFPNGSTAANGPGPPHYRGFTITLRHTELGRTPLDDWSAQCRDLYLTTHNTHKRQTSMPPSRIRTSNPSKRAAADPRVRPRGHRDRRIYT
jgi:hypothetical protein